MKQLFLLVSAGLLFCPVINYGSETAHARLYCTSLRFGEGTTSGGTLDISSIAGTQYNGELMYYSGDTWYSGLVLYWSGYADSGMIYVNLPPAVDANNDGFDDFFESSQGVTNEVTSGSYPATYNGYFGGGGITATWNRAAGSASGTCVLQLNDSLWGYITYTCPFTLLEYTGPVTFTPGSNSVSAAVNLSQTGDPAKTLRGPINFVKDSYDPYNTLYNQPGTWTNASSQTLNFDSETFTRDTRWPTNYFGPVYFNDGDPSTTSQDYIEWGLSIDDTNDANANGIPDFSDVPYVAPPRAPYLILMRGATNLLLQISGDVGHTNYVQGINSLASTNWLTAQTFFQTNDPQMVSLPLPATTTKFWRVKVQ